MHLSVPVLLALSAAALQVPTSVSVAEFLKLPVSEQTRTAQPYFRYVIAYEGYEESRGSFERDMDDLLHATHAAKLNHQVRRILMDNVRSSGGTVAAYDQQKAALEVSYTPDLERNLAPPSGG